MLKKNAFGGDLALVAKLVAAGIQVGAGRDVFGALAHDTRLLAEIVAIASAAGPTYEPAAVAALTGMPVTEDGGEPPASIPGYITFWDPGCSIQEFMRRTGVNVYRDGMSFARREGVPGYVQLRIAQSPETMGLGYAEAVGKVEEDEEPASARELVIGFTLYRLVTGAWPQGWGQHYVTDVAEVGDFSKEAQYKQVCLGGFADDQIQVHHLVGGPGAEHYGLAVKKKKTTT